MTGIAIKAVRALLTHPETWVIAVPVLAVAVIAYGVQQHRENAPKEEPAE